jgi:hypothetical protein
MPLPPQLVGKAVPITKQPNRGKGCGRKPKLIKKWIKASNLSKKDAQAVLLDFLTSYTPERINDMVKSEYGEMSMLAYLFLLNVNDAIKKNDFSKTREMLDFIFGGEPQVKVTNNTQMVDLKAVILAQAGESPEERGRIIGELEKITGYEERG